MREREYVSARENESRGRGEKERGVCVNERGRSTKNIDWSKIIDQKKIQVPIMMLNGMSQDILSHFFLLKKFFFTSAKI